MFFLAYIACDLQVRRGQISSKVVQLIRAHIGTDSLEVILKRIEIKTYTEYHRS